jgi:hypothetical protein
MIDLKGQRARWPGGGAILLYSVSMPNSPLTGKKYRRIFAVLRPFMTHPPETPVVVTLVAHDPPGPFNFSW